MHLRSVRTSVALLVAALFLATPPSALAADPQGTTVYLVRHAEKEADGGDPSLSVAGRARAARLAEILSKEPIGRILTTDRRRTRETAAPLAAARKVEVEVYDPFNLAAVASKLKDSQGVVLVVGHSNTTGELVRLLGGDPGTPIADSEYDRLYRVELPSGKTLLQRIPAE